MLERRETADVFGASVDHQSHQTNLALLLLPRDGLDCYDLCDLLFRYATAAVGGVVWIAHVQS